MEREHGTRATSVHDRCHCIPSFHANRIHASTNQMQREYELRPAKRVRAHLLAMGQAAVGYKQAAEVCGSGQKGLTVDGQSRVQGRIRDLLDRVFKRWMSEVEA